MTGAVADIPHRRLSWANAARIVAGRLRRESAFEQVASLADLALVLEIVDRGRTLIAPDDLPAAGPGVSYVLAPFRIPHASRFSDGSYGVLYAGRNQKTARAEYGFHLARFLAATRERAQPLTLLSLSLEIRGNRFADLWPAAALRTDLFDPDPARYGRPQEIGAELRSGDADGVVFPSVRSPGGSCGGVFRPRCVVRCEPRGRLYVEWTSEKLKDWAEIRPV